MVVGANILKFMFPCWNDPYSATRSRLKRMKSHRSAICCDPNREDAFDRMHRLSGPGISPLSNKFLGHEQQYLLSAQALQANSGRIWLLSYLKGQAEAKNPDGTAAQSPDSGVSAVAKTVPDLSFTAGQGAKPLTSTSQA